MTNHLNRYSYDLTDEDLQSRVLFKDKSMIVINKPSGINVHPGISTPDSLEEHFSALRFDRREDPKLAHRLDRDTSGCLILSRRKSARSKLGKMFQNKRITKRYWAIVKGCPEENNGTVDNYIKKEKDERGWYAKICGKKDKKGKHSITKWKILKKYDGYTWLEVEPLTGRTHQIRIHCSSLGCPIIGDWVYDRETNFTDHLPPLHLHARSIMIPFYHDEKPIYVEADAPEHMVEKIG